MAATTNEAQSLKGMLRKPGKPVSIEEMNQAIVKGGTGWPAKAFAEGARLRGEAERDARDGGAGRHGGDGGQVSGDGG
jgi:hypothetical protein